MSVFPSVSKLRRTRSRPSSPSSSSPAVSVSTTGPSGSHSIARRTGSVVVPFTSDTSATSCPASRLISKLFPAFRRPKNPMCVRSPDGVSFIPLISSLLSSLFPLTPHS